MLKVTEEEEGLKVVRIEKNRTMEKNNLMNLFLTQMARDKIKSPAKAAQKALKIRKKTSLMTKLPMNLISRLYSKSFSNISLINKSTRN